MRQKKKKEKAECFFFFGLVNHSKRFFNMSDLKKKFNFTVTW